MSVTESESDSLDEEHCWCLGALETQYPKVQFLFGSALFSQAFGVGFVKDIKFLYHGLYCWLVALLRHVENEQTPHFLQYKMGLELHVEESSVSIGLKSGEFSGMQ